MPRGNPAALALGPGLLYIAPLGTIEPLDLMTPWNSVSLAWVGLGYTDTGSTWNYQLTTGDVLVAEELDPVAKPSESRASSVDFGLKEITATNLRRALNGGTLTPFPGQGFVTFEPPDLGAEVHTMIGFESEDHSERWIFRECLSTGAIALPRAKGSASATLPCSFQLMKPVSGARLFRAILAAPQRQ